MTDLKSDKDKLNVALDATMLDTFLSCPQKYYFRHELNKVPIELAAPLDRGQLVHQGLEAYYKSLMNREPWNEAVLKMRDAVNLAATESQLNPEEILKLKDTLLETTDYYKSVDCEYEILAVEEPFAYCLHEDELMKIVMLGKIDLLVNWREYKNVPIDHKTYSRDTPVRRKTNQFCNYAYACSSNYLIVNRVGLQKTLKAEEKHKRIPLSYDPEFLAQWKANVIQWVNFYVDCHINKNFPLNDTSCDKYNRLCEYYDICDSSGQDSKEFKLQLHFNDAEKWDPSKVLD
jgi:hypothetical protein